MPLYHGSSVRAARRTWRDDRTRQFLLRQRGVKLHVGAGEDYRVGWTNLDVRADVGADLVGDIRDLSAVPDGTVEEILALDVLEHVPRSDTQVVLREFQRVLIDGGLLTLRVPNLHALCVQIAYWADKPGPQLTALLDNVYGGHKWPEVDVHHWGFTPASLALDLATAGFENIENDLGLNMTVTARKAAPTLNG